MTKNVWGYFVVSSEDQSDTLPHQLAWAKEEATRHGWELTRIFDGVASGRDGVRAIFDDMLSALKATPPENRPAFILMTRLDRIGRGNMVESQVALHEVHTLGTKVWSREGGEVKLDTAMDALIAAVKLAVGSQENEVRRDKSQATWVQRRKARQTDPRRALTSKPPYGTAYEGGYLVPKYPEADAIRMMFDLRLQGYGSHVIGKKLATVAPPITQKNGVTRPLVWNADLVSRGLKRHAYADAGIVSEAEYQRAQAMRSTRGGSQAKIHAWTLVGALRCECGTPLKGMTNKARGLFYYACSDRFHVHGKYLCHRRENIEQQFWALMWTLNKQPLFAATPASDDHQNRKLMVTRLTALRAEIAKIPARIQNVWDAFDDGSLRKDALQGRLDALAAQEQKATTEAAELEAALEAMKVREMTDEERAGVLKTATSRWRKADAATRKALAKQVSSALGGINVNAEGTFVLGGVNGVPLQSVIA